MSVLIEPTRITNNGDHAVLVLIPTPGKAPEPGSPFSDLFEACILHPGASVVTFRRDHGAPGGVDVIDMRTVREILAPKKNG